MKKLKLSIYTAIIFCLLYSIAWLGVSFFLSSRLNSNFAGKSNLISGFGDEEYKISFQKATPSGFPFKFGVRVDGVTEESLSAMITHYQPLYIGYDLLRGSFVSEYSGKSVARPKPVHTGFGTEISGTHSSRISYPALKLLIGKLDFLNFAQGVEFISRDTKAYDIIDRSLLYSASYLTAKLNISRGAHYETLGELKNNPPTHYHLTSKAKIDDAVADRRIASASLIYGIIGTHKLEHDIDIELSGEAKNHGGLVDFIKNMELKSNKWHYLDEGLESDVKVYVQSVTSAEDTKIKLQYFSLLEPKAGFITSSLELYKSIAILLLESREGAMLLKPTLEKLLKDPKRYLPDSIDAKKLQSTIDAEFQVADKSLVVNINKLSFLADDAGFDITGSGLLSASSSNAKGHISLSQYQHVIDFIADYSNKIFDTPSSADMLALKKAVYKIFYALYPTTRSQMPPS